MSNFGLIRQGPSRAALQAIPTPQIRDDYILVQTAAIALNPTDWTSLDAVGNEGVLNGCDYAGVVVEAGPKVTRFKPGDRVTGVSHGANDADPETGAFARYVLAKGDIQLHIPDDVGFEAAVSSGGSGNVTTGLALYHFLGLPWPEAHPAAEEEGAKVILIYGASTAVGSIAIQFAKLSGWKVVTTCSPKHFAMVTARGIDAVYDYNAPDVGEQIRRDTHGRIAHVLDTVAVASSAAICAAAIGPAGGHYVNLLGIECPRTDVRSEFFLGYSMSGESYICEGETYPAEPAFFEFVVKFNAVSERLWREGKWQTHPHRVFGGGLLGAVEGLQRRREGRGPSGEKWVYRTEDTEWPQ